MKRALAWFAENHVAANILMIMIVVCGVVALPTIRQEVFPSVDLPVLTVTVDYPGASPSEVEEAICVRLEEALQGMGGVKRIHASAHEGRGSVSVELRADEDVAQRLSDVKTRIDRIEGLPAEAKRPEIEQVAIRMQVVDVAVSGLVDEKTLKRLGEQVRDEIAALPGVSDVELVAARPYEIAIEVSEAALLRHGVTFDDVVHAVQRSSVDMPGGSVRTSGGEILLRTRGQARTGDDFARIPLITQRDGTQLRLGDVAAIDDGFEETERRAFFDGAPAVIVQVYRVGDQSAIDISNQVREYVAATEPGLPAGVSLTLAQDDSLFLRGRIETLTRNAQSGFLLVLLVLALFLRLRLAFWVSLGVPLSFLGALAVMPTLDVSINLISLMAFIVVLGIVVDDAIIVGENTYTEQARGGSRLAGAIRGVHGVATPVVFGVLTTIASFSPMLFIPGPMGRIARVIPLVVCACLVFSLIESLFVLPAHLGHGQGPKNGEDDVPSNPVSQRWRALQTSIADGLERFLEHRYRPFLDRALEWRYLTAAVGVATLVVTTGLLQGGWVRFVFQPDVEGDVTVAYVNMPLGTPPEATAEAVHEIEQAAARVAAEIAADGAAGEAPAGEATVFKHVLTTVGQQPYKLKQATGPSAYAAAMQTGSHLGEVQLEVVPSEQRDVTVAEITRRWRAATGAIPGAEELSFTSSILSAGSPLAVELAGDDLAALREAADGLAAMLAGYPGVLDITDTFRGGKQELEIELKPAAEVLGLTDEDLGRQVRQAFFGAEAQRLQRGRADVPVMVRYPAEDRHSLGSLEQMRIRTREGDAVPFSAVAGATLVEGVSSISRKDRRRIVTVTAEVDENVVTANEIVADLAASGRLEEIERAHPGVAFSFGGEQREQAEFLSSLGRGWLIALLAIYALLAVPLKSYSQPFIIMAAIPFGLVGAVWGHALMGHDFSMFSLIGLVALSGVVVNDSLVMVDYVNGRRREGVGLDEAVRIAGRARFRAILLTSLTTFAGLTPLLLETSVQARMLIPMAISLGFGVLAATAITLLLVPAIYMIVEDAKAALFGRSTAAEDANDRATTHATA